MPLQVDTFLQGGKYRIVRFIASGGFGCTYEAVHTLLLKRVAIKEFFVKDFCNRDLTTGEVSVGATSRSEFVSKLKSKFLDEARNLSGLNHTGIVKVTDVFEENGTAYFVMDYIEGESLDVIVRKVGMLPENKAVKYILDVCDALEYVHKNHRLHLDIKPGNIIVDSHDNAILIDFGASKQYDASTGKNKSTLLGKTPGFAPLEQLGNDVSTFLPATDIYSLGATFYKMLTGATPPGSHLLACGEQLPPLPDSISPRVNKAVMWALELNKKSRPQSIKAFRDVLTGGLQAADEEEKTVVVHPQNKDGKKMGTGTILAFIGAICMIIAGILIIRSGLSEGEDPAGKEVRQTVISSPSMVTNMEYVNSKGVAFTYTGEINSDSVPHGKGTGVYEEGVYTGMYENGLRNGSAEYDTKSGKNHFEGTYEDDMYKEGTLEFDDKSYYKGTFKNNEFFTGVFYNPDGTKDDSVTEGK